MASYFVIATGLVLEMTAIGLLDSEMAFLVQFALYFASLGFHIEDARNGDYADPHTSEKSPRIMA